MHREFLCRLVHLPQRPRAGRQHAHLWHHDLPIGASVAGDTRVPQAQLSHLQHALDPLRVPPKHAPGRHTDAVRADAERRLFGLRRRAPTGSDHGVTRRVHQHPGDAVRHALGEQFRCERMEVLAFQIDVFAILAEYVGSVLRQRQLFAERFACHYADRALEGRIQRRRVQARIVTVLLFFRPLGEQELSCGAHCTRPAHQSVNDRPIDRHRRYLRALFVDLERFLVCHG
jgi:hypothetical protein